MRRKESWGGRAQRHPTVDGWDRGRPEAGASPEEAAAVQSGPVQPEGGDRSPAAWNSGVMGVKGDSSFQDASRKREAETQGVD